jgi:hypothetical protein
MLPEAYGSLATGTMPGTGGIRTVVAIENDIVIKNGYL